MLSLTEIVEYTVNREGLFLIPLSAFKFDMSRMENLFYNVVREYEAYMPLIAEEYMHVTREGTYLPGAKAIKSLEFAGSVNAPKTFVKSLLRPVNKRLWHFDKYSQTLSAQANSFYLVKYIKQHTFENLHMYETVGRPYRGQEQFSGKLKAEPDINSLRIVCGCHVATFEAIDMCCDQEVAILSGDLGDAQYNMTTREFTILFNGNHHCEPVVAEYITKYKGFKELEIGQNNSLLTDWFAAELYCGAGSLFKITQLEQSPVKWDSTNLLEYGRQLRDSVKERRNTQMNWYEWLP